MKITNQGVDCGTPFFAVQTNKNTQEIEQEFQEMYPQNNIVVIKPDNIFINDRYVVRLLPKEFV